MHLMFTPSMSNSAISSMSRPSPAFDRYTHHLYAALPQHRAKSLPAAFSPRYCFCSELSVSRTPARSLRMSYVDLCSPFESSILIQTSPNTFFMPIIYIINLNIKFLKCIPGWASGFRNSARAASIVRTSSCFSNDNVYRAHKPLIRRV